MNPLVKICGIRRPDDARLAVELGATHIGVVRPESSPRWADPQQARDVFDAIRGKAETVFVFRDIPIDQAIEDAHVARATCVQLYAATDADVESAASAGFRVFRVYRMDEDTEQLPSLAPAPTDARPALLDVGGGGTGRRFDWSLLGERAPDWTFVAGGVRPGNVNELLARHPYGIDLASGVESAPGVKDEAKLRALFEEVRSWRHR